MDFTKKHQSSSLSRRDFLKTSLKVTYLSTIYFLIPSKSYAQPISTVKIQNKISGFKNPYGVAVNSKGHIFVSDAGGYCVKAFDQSGNFIKQIGSPGSGNGKFNYPQGIFIDANDDIFVVDSNNGRIQIFDSEGNFRSTFGSVGGYPEAFYTPKGIFVSDQIYVCNTRNHALSVYDKTTFRLTCYFGELGDDPPQTTAEDKTCYFRQPTDVAIGKDGNIFVVDSKHGEIKVLDQKGQLLNKFSQNGSEEGQLNFPEGIAIDSENNIYVCDALNSRIQKFSAAGKYLNTLILKDLQKPTSLFIDKNHLFYLVDSEAKQLIIFEWNA